jgi:hypothetical protein
MSDLTPEQAAYERGRTSGWAEVAAAVLTLCHRVELDARRSDHAPWLSTTAVRAALVDAGIPADRIEGGVA